MKKLTTLIAAIAMAGALTLRADEQKTGETQIKGEILDLTCYVDHGASGDKHSKCAAGCIGSGLPVGIKAENGTVYLVVGEHKPLNQELAPFAGKVVTLRGKVASRDGVNLLENAVIVK